MSRERTVCAEKLSRKARGRRDSLCAVLLLDDLQEGFLEMDMCLLRVAQPWSGPGIHVAEEICWLLCQLHFRWASSWCLLAGRDEVCGQERRAGQTGGTEHPSLPDLCCHNRVLLLFATASHNEY